MKLRTNVLHRLLALIGLTVSAVAMAGNETPRGADVGGLAANCEIGNYPQTSKAGHYNALCHVMSDAEKCLALLKNQFNYDGEQVTIDIVNEPPHVAGRAAFCLQVLKEALNISE